VNGDGSLDGSDLVGLVRALNPAKHSMTRVRAVEEMSGLNFDEFVDLVPQPDLVLEGGANCQGSEPRQPTAACCL
jgi:hypothetical protein